MKVHKIFGLGRCADEGVRGEEEAWALGEGRKGWPKVQVEEGGGYVSEDVHGPGRERRMQ